MAGLFCWVFNETASYLLDGVFKDFVDCRKVVVSVARVDEQSFSFTNDLNV